MSYQYSVNVLNLPTTITIHQLAQTFQLPNSRIYLPRIQKTTSYHAWINDFNSEQDANDFVKQWSNSHIFGGRSITCYAKKSNITRRNSSSSSSSLSSMSTEMETCPDGILCSNVNCEFTHPNEWHPCPKGAECRNYECICNHPSRRKAKCRDGDRCKISTCKFLHPNTRPNKCKFHERCNKWDCERTHPSSRTRLCPDKERCTNVICLCLHPPSRPFICNQPSTDSSLDCNSDKSLKSLEQRMKDWEQSQLPIFTYRTEFCNRLQDEHMLVVTAETGSGKSTQLPQYAAEHFGSLVVCTQPRVVAALSLAHRVAEEYDGISVGQSVGYKAGHGNQIDGKKIMFMTDAALIRESQRDPQLKHIRVLIIDEAHERSLNTDIVLGIAKLLLVQRPHDFYVVIASATIDPTRFLQYFDRESNSVLEVEGRVFPVTMTNKPPLSDWSDQILIEKHVIPSINEFYSRYEGHVLVFLPGQGEIEKALKFFQSNIPNNCVALPLYGSQSPEEQERVIKFNEKNKRMVVFCTNVAETSLTIPNVRLVIDSGWAKEARYDTKRRLTVIETVRISRSSADQRKGRAGRTAVGHCVRLYADAELVRANIEPEILRSSLDLVLLQLIRLNLNPTTFPFMDQPHIDIIRNSIDLLTRLKCIDNEQITKRGELFTELGLDPRFSAFIIDIYTQYQSLLELATGIVSILSAPGSLFFMGGPTQQAKDEAKMKIASQAQKYQSDLMHLYNVYDTWKNVTSGNCRIKHSNENGLNNKILQNINSTSISIIKQIKNASWLIAGNEFPENQMHIISRHLANLFPEQCGYLLVPQLPIEGVHLVSTDVRATITNTSVFRQKRQIDQHFIAMTITQLSSGRYIIEKLHPIPRSLTTIQTSIVELYVVRNISSLIFHCMRRKLNTFRAESWAKWVVYQYDRSRCCCIVWGFESTKSQIVPIVQQTYTEVVNKFYEDFYLRTCGPIKATFQAGLQCIRINRMINTLRLDLKNVPHRKRDELINWLNKTMDVDQTEIEHYKFQGQTRNLRLFFKNDEAYRRATNKTPIYFLNQEENEFGFRRDTEKDSWGRQLTIETPGTITTQDIITKYGVRIITDCIQLNKQNKIDSIEASFKLNNLPSHFSETHLRDCLRDHNGPQPKEIVIKRSKNNVTAWTILTFNDPIQCNRAAAICGLQLCQQPFSITYCGKSGGQKTKFIRTELERNYQKQIPPNRFLITVINREEAAQIFYTHSDWKVDGSATVTVHRLSLYPNYEEIVNDICLKHGVKVLEKKTGDDNKRFTFINAHPRTASLVASMFAKNFTSMTIQLTTERQKILFSELEELGELENWTKELILGIERNEAKTKIEIRGAQIAQGEFMRRVADYSDRFEQRFREFELNSTLTTFFGPQSAANSKLQEIHSRWSTKLCSVSFNPKTSTITVLGKPNVKLEDFDACKKEIIQFLTELTATVNDEESDDDEKEEEEEEEDDNENIIRSDRSCVFCKQKSSISTNLFRICGHAYCRCAAQHLGTSISFPLKCKDCETKIHIRDIELIFNNNEQFFMRLLKNSIQNYLKDNTQEDDRVFCPNYECNGLIKLSLGYQICLFCGQNVCSQCQTINDYSHINQTCEQLNQIQQRSGFLPEMFRAARKFVQDNWPIGPDMQPRCPIDENPYLENGYKSLKRFYRGVEMLGLSSPPSLSRGLFAFHGTAAPAIVPICENGFDPKRRSGQVYGRGEYFGITANVSHGYTQKQGSQPGVRQMIIAFILRCPQMTTRENFCYIVDNPINWEYTFTLPVLIVTYGPMARLQPSPFPSSIPMYIDDDETNTPTANNVSSWHAPFRWYWRQDNNQFQPYNDSDNLILEKSYEHWKLRGGPAKIDTAINGSWFMYQIDYKTNQQINTQIYRPRKIERRLLDKSTEKKQWFYQDRHSMNWIRYDTSMEILIDNSFNSYRFKDGSFMTDIQTSKINFISGQMINGNTSLVENIKYQQGCPEPVKIDGFTKFLRDVGQTFSNIFGSKK